MTNPSYSALMHLLRAHARIEQRIDGALGSVHGLSLKEALLLLHLQQAPRGRLSRVDLAKRLNTSPSTITRMALPLEKLRMVGRDSDERDARLVYVVLTKAGATLVENARATLERLAGEIFRDRWSKPDIAALVDLLGRMTANEPGDLTT